MRSALVVLTVLFIGGCAGIRGVQLDGEYGEARPRYRQTADTTTERVNYQRDVKPVLESRCVACHGCYTSRWPRSTWGSSPADKSGTTLMCSIG